MQLPPNSPLLLLAGLGAAAVALFLWRTTAHNHDRKIRIVGVGGGGANAVDAMIRARLRGVEYVVVNTDARALKRSSANTKLAIGRQITTGLGTGGDAGAGEVAARDATDQIGRAVAGSEFVVIAAGLGGGTGSGAAPVIAEIARQKGALTMAVVTTPFGFEGTRRQKLAQQAAGTLAGKVDAVATVPNDRVRDEMPATATMEDVFRAIDETLCRTVGEILDLVTGRGRMNLDFADVRGVFQGGGAAAVGIGRAAGENRAIDATRTALAAALPAGSNAGPTAILVNLAGSSKLRLAEVDAVAETVRAAAGQDPNLVLGLSVRPRLRDELEVTVIATGLGRTTSADARATAPAGPLAAERIDAVIDTAPDAAPAWQPVWLRRAPVDRSAPVARHRRKGVTEAELDASPAKGTGVDPT